MKKISIILLVAVSFVFFSCKKDNDTLVPPPANTNTTPAVNPFATDGRWLVYMNVDGVDHSADFAASTTIFSPNNSFSVSNDIMAASGAWTFEKSADNITFLRLEFNSDNVNNDAWRNMEDLWKVTSLDEKYLTLESTTGLKTMSLVKLVR